MFKRPDIKLLNHWVYEAHTASRDERAERWRDAELYDGDQWTQEDWEAAQDAGVNPLTINRVFPVVNLLRGHQILNRYNIIAKGRTQKDATVSEVMSEGIKFVMDQSDGQFLLSQCFLEQIVPGWGCSFVGQNPDPREERIMLDHRPWPEMYWDPFGGPWLDAKRCRYVFHSPWLNLEDLQAQFPAKAKDIEAAHGEMSGSMLGNSWGQDEDEADEIEDEHLSALAPSGWARVSPSKRVRPVEMWYPVHEIATFLIPPDGKVFELTDDADPREIYQIIQAYPPGSIEKVTAPVRKMQVTTFMGDLVLQDMPSPCAHDLYPFVPFIGYLDRYGYPYGVPRQIRGQNEEVNKRRSMALAHLQKRRIMIEQTAIPADSSAQTIYEEANKLDGMMVLNDGGMNRVKLDEQLNLSQAQAELLSMAEAEIQEISGANDERLGQNSRAMSGNAIDKRVQRSETVTASVFDNLRRSTTILGRLVCLEIQGNWRGEKVLRITDSVTKADRYVTLNQRVQTGQGVAVLNDVTQGKYDITVSEAPHTDTIREQSANLLMETIKKSPPEVIPQLVLLWFEISNLPNKDQIMAKIRPLFGEGPGDEDKSPEEIKAEMIQRIEAEQAKKQAQEQHDVRLREAEAAKVEAEVAKVMAEVQEIMARTKTRGVEAGAKALDAETRHEQGKIGAFKSGVETALKVQGARGAQVPAASEMSPSADLRQDREWRQTYR